MHKVSGKRIVKGQSSNCSFFVYTDQCLREVHAILHFQQANVRFQLSYRHFQIEKLRSEPKVIDSMRHQHNMCQIRKISSSFGKLGHKQSRRWDFQIYPNFPVRYLKRSMVQDQESALVCTAALFILVCQDLFFDRQNLTTWYSPGA